MALTRFAAFAAGWSVWSLTLPKSSRNVAQKAVRRRSWLTPTLIEAIPETTSGVSRVAGWFAAVLFLLFLDLTLSQGRDLILTMASSDHFFLDLRTSGGLTPRCRLEARLWHAHHLIGHAVRLILVSIVGRADGRLGLQRAGRAGWRTAVLPVCQSGSAG